MKITMEILKRLIEGCEAASEECINPDNHYRQTLNMLNEINPPENVPSEWTEWSGGECPFSDDIALDIKMRSGNIANTKVIQNSLWDWQHNQSEFDIVAYKVAAQ